MKKVKSKQIFMGVLVASIALCMLVYLLVFNKYNSETDALKTSNAALQAQADEMKQYYDNLATYRSGIAQMTKGVNDMTLDYASEANEEDFIMTAVAMQNAAVINYDKVNIDVEEVIHTIPVETVKGSGIEGLEEPIEFLERKASYSNTTDYANLKNCVKVIYDNGYRVGIDNISYKRESEENNFIKGTIDITYFTLKGMNKGYEYPEMDDYLSGVVDLFNKMVVGKDDKGRAEE